jgi:cyclopropane-fatty-acyl-phospholipid synthase
MWEFYLGISEIAFRHLGQMVFQIQLAKRVDAVPITRDYLYEPNMEPIAASRSAEVCLRRAG